MYVTPTGATVCDTEREARHVAARHLGVENLRGLSQAPTNLGTRFFAPGADEDGESVEILPTSRGWIVE